jgi:hypothetical protein
MGQYVPPQLRFTFNVVISRRQNSPLPLYFDPHSPYRKEVANDGILIITLRTNTTQRQSPHNNNNNNNNNLIVTAKQPKGQC